MHPAISSTGQRGEKTARCRLLGLVCLTGTLVASAQAQVVINEVMADNRSAVENGSDFPDYLELFNTSTQAVSLAGMSLTDDGTQPRLFVFPAGTTMAGLAYRVVWCDTNLASPGLHTGFALGAKGERVRLYAADGVTQVDSIRYGLQLPNQTVGRVPDGTGAWVLTRATPRTTNTAKILAAPTQLRLNEWMARPSAGNDWLEARQWRKPARGPGGPGDHRQHQRHPDQPGHSRPFVHRRAGLRAVPGLGPREERRRPS